MQNVNNRDADTTVIQEADDSSFRNAALNTEQSFIVEASAGSGKTELLIQRYLKLLTQVEEPEQILAITFTRKAAAEMRDRILQELCDAEAEGEEEALTPHKLFTRKLAAAALEASRNRNWNLTRQPQRMNVRTIDSLCIEITARLPVLTRMGGAMQPVTDATSLYNSAAREVLEQLGGDDRALSDSIQILLLHLDNRFESVTHLLANLLATRDHWASVLPLGSYISNADFDNILHEQFERTLEKIHASASKALQAVLAPGMAEQLCSLLQYAANELAAEQRANPHAACLSWAQIPAFDAEHAHCWTLIANLLLTREGTFRKQVTVTNGFPAKSPRKREMLDLLESFTGDAALLAVLRELQILPPMRYTDQQKKVLRASFLLLRHALAQLKIIFARTGTTDFTELLLAARQALEEDTNSIALSLGTSIQHLLVDEMQDTSVTQFHLLQLLVQSWDGSSQTVFLVGDPKQSIYRFRQAEVALFTRARRYGLNEVQLETISLTRNFRSQQSLVETTNKYFAGIFSHPDDVDAIPFQPSQAANVEGTLERVHWHPAIYAKSKTENSSNPALMEAQILCDVIEQYRAADQISGHARSIAILVSNKRHAWPLFKEMQQRRISYRAIEMDTLRDRQSLLDLLSITRCLLHAADRTAWLAVLRAPWCGLTLADLHVLCGNDEAQFRYWTVPELLQSRIGLLSEDGHQRAKRTWAALKKALSFLQQEPLSTLVERTWHTLGGPACIPVSDASAVIQFLDMLHALEEESGAITAGRIEERMEKLYAPALPSGEFSVEVLTIHKAKGLEWDIVLLPGMHNKPRHEDPKLLVWQEEIAAGSEDAQQEPQIFLAPIKHASEESEPIGQWIRRRIAQREESERRRVFYVAGTRARTALHLFASVAKNEKGELIHPDKRSLLHIAWPFAEEIFTQLQTVSVEPRGNVLTMPGPAIGAQPKIAMNLAAEAERVTAQTIPLSNFRRLPADWVPAATAADVMLAAQPGWVDGILEKQGPAFLRPEGSWKARVFGTVLHALMQPLAHILHTKRTGEIEEDALQILREPATLRMMQSGYAHKDAQTAADRMLHILMDVSRDPLAQWLLAAHSNVHPQLPDFEIPLTALYENVVRSVRLDRMFLAGAEPLISGGNQLWIVDFKTSAHGEKGLANFLEDQKIAYADQMQMYAAVVRAAYPEARKIHLGLYYPLLKQFTWWMNEAGQEEFRE